MLRKALEVVVFVSLTVSHFSIPRRKKQMMAKETMEKEESLRGRMGRKVSMSKGETKVTKRRGRTRQRSRAALGMQ